MASVADEILSVGPTEYEKTYVHDVYDRISSHFSNTRYKAWPKVKKFVDQGLQPESSQTALEDILWIDVGCGNGKNFPEILEKTLPTAFGFDRCKNLVDIAAAKTQGRVQLMVADAMDIPFRSNIFQGCICIAVLHHITTVERRIRLIRECARILTPNAFLLFYSWAKEQDKVQSDTQDVLVPWKPRQCDENEVMTENRFCHLYEQNEVEGLIESHCGDVLRVVQSYYDRENWAVICQKK